MDTDQLFPLYCQGSTHRQYQKPNNIQRPHLWLHVQPAVISDFICRDFFPKDLKLPGLETFPDTPRFCWKEGHSLASWGKGHCIPTEPQGKSEFYQNYHATSHNSFPLSLDPLYPLPVWSIGVFRSKMPIIKYSIYTIYRGHKMRGSRRQL